MRDGEIVVDLRTRSKIKYTMPVGTDKGDVFFIGDDGKEVSVEQMLQAEYSRGADDEQQMHNGE